MATTSSVVISLLLLSAAFFCCRAARDQTLDAFLPNNPDGFSSKGNEFYVGFSENDVTSDPPTSVGLFITTDEPVDVSVRVTSDLTTPPYDVTRTTGYGRHAVFSLPQTPTAGVDFRVTDGTQRNKAIYIKAEGNRRVSVYGFNHEQRSSDAFQVYPCHEFDISGRYVYMIMSEKGHNTEPRQSQFLMVGCDRATTNVRIFPATSITLPGATQQTLRGTRGDLNIAGRDTYLVTTGSELDPTGTVLRSNQPLAVFSGHQCSQVPFGVTACDHLVEQIPPHVVWGRLFFTVPVLGRTSGENYRIGAIEADTVVTATCVRIESTTPTNELRVTIPGGNPNTGVQIIPNWAEFDTVNGNDPQFCCIEANKPVIVMQYSKGHTLNSPTSEDGDPFMATVPPVRQYLNNFTVTSSKEISQNFTGSVGVTVSSVFFDNSMSARNSIQVDGNPLVPANSDGWTPIYCNNLEVCGYGAREEVGAGSFNVFHTNPLAGMYVEVTGLDREVSFGYTSGLEFQATGLAIVIIDDVDVREEVGTVDVTIRKVGNAGFVLNFDVATRAFTGSGLGATVGADYTQTTMRISMARTVFSTTVTIPIIIDQLPEQSERFELAIVQSTVDNALLQKPVGVITILDVQPTQPPVTFRFDPTSYTYSESVGMASLTIVKSAATTETITLEFSTVGDTAQAGSDYTEVSSSVVTFGPNDLTQTVQVQILPDNVYERTERFFGNINNPSSGTIAVDGNQAEVFIQDETTLIVGFDPDTYTYAESSGSAELTIRLFGATEVPVSVFFSTQDGSALSPDDFTAISRQRVMFQASAAAQTSPVSVQIRMDGIVENTENFSGLLELDVSAERITANPSTANVMITDNDRVTIGFDPDSYSVDEGGNVVFTIVKQGVNTIPVSVTFSTVDGTASAPGDYTGESGTTVTFGPNDTTMTVTIPTNDDGVYESPETFLGQLSMGSSGVTLGVSQATATINDVNTLIIEFDPVMYTVTEGGSGMFRIVKRGQAAVPVSVSLSTGQPSDTASAPADYTSISSMTVTFAPGQSEVFVPFFTVNDSTIEGPETFSAVISNAPARVTLGASIATVNINEVQDVMVQFDPTMYTVSEGGVVSFTIRRLTPTTKTIEVIFDTVPGSASAPDDYTAVLNQVVTFGPSDDTQIVQVMVNTDNIAEEVETFFGRLSLPSGSSGVAIVGGDATAIITDTNNVTVGFDPTMYTVDEGGVVSFTIRRLTPATRTFSVIFNTVPGSAMAPGDYTAVLDRVVTFGPSDETQTVQVTVNTDNIAEEVETFFGRLSLAFGSSGVAISGGDATATINDTNIVTVGFDPTMYNVSEGGVVSFTIRRLTPATRTFSVIFDTVPGSAMAPGDYIAVLDRVVTFGPSDETQTVQVMVNTDNIAEADEMFFGRLSLAFGSSGVGISGGGATATIFDSGAGLTVEFTTDMFPVPEDNDTISVCLRTNIGSQEALVINVTATVKTTGSNTATAADFVPSTTTITFPPSSMGQVRCTRFTILDDPIALEGNETFNLRFMRVSGASAMPGTNSMAWAQIIDNDVVRVRFTEDEYSALEDEENITAFIMRDRPIASAFTVTVIADEFSPADAEDVTDFIAVRRQLTFEPNDSDMMSIEVPIIDDTVKENLQETFEGVIEVPTTPGVELGTPATATLIIIDDDVLIVDFITDIFPVPEDNGTINICLQTNTGSQQELVINVMATVKTNGSDLASADDFVPGTTTITFPPSRAGQVRCTQFTILDDNLALEGDETFDLRFMRVSGANAMPGTNSQAWAQIIDDDVVRVRFTENDYAAREDEGPITACIIRDRPIASAFTVTVNADELSPADAENGTDFIAVSRQLTFEPSGPDTLCIDVPIIDDTKQENPRENFEGVIEVPTTPGVELGTPATATLIIIDNEALIVDFTTDMFPVPEDNGTINICLRTNTGSQQELVINVMASVKTTGSDLASADDFVPGTNTITFPPSTAGQVRCTRFTILDDTLALEGNETFNLEFMRVSGATAMPGTNSMAWARIIDNDDVEIGFERPSYTVEEGDGSVTVCLVTSTGIARPVTVGVTSRESVPEDATESEDFVAATNQVTFPASSSSSRQCTSFTIIDDNVAIEGPETFVAVLNLPPTVQPGQIIETVITILDDDVLTVDFTTNMFPVPEDNGTINICLRTNIGSQEELVINVMASVKTTGSNLASADDFVPGTSTVTFPPSTAGQVRCTQFTILDDTLALEGDETFNVEFVRVSGATAMAWAQIIDNDVVRVRFTEDDYAAREDEGPITACIIRDRPIASAFTVTVNADELSPADAENGTDFIAVSRRLTFEPSGSDTLCIDVPIIDDTKQENPQENFEGVIEVPITPGVELGTPATATLIIIDNEVLTVDFTTDMFPVPEDNGTINICLRTNTGSQQELVINVMASVKTNGSDLASTDDFVPGTNTITFPPSTTGQVRCTQFTILDDTLALEGDETFDLRFMRVSGATAIPGTNSMAWARIIDNDVVEIGFERPSYTVDEGDGSVTVCLMTSTGIARPVTVDVTSRESVPEDATESEDFVAETNQVTFPASSSSSRQCTSFTIINDDVAREGNETFVAVVDTPSDVRPGPITQTVITIVDDDVLNIQLVTQNVVVDESSGQVMICLTKDKDTQEPLIVTVATSPNTATDGSDFTGHNDTITFNPTDVMACDNVTIIDDTKQEVNEGFKATFTIPGVGGLLVLQLVANVTIIDDDGPTDIGICRITSPLSISAFNRTETYRFSGTCEHTLVRSCVPTTPDFAVTVDFVSEDLSNGRIGLRYGSSYFIYREDGSVVVYNAALSGEVGNVRSYNVSGSIVTVTTQSDGTVVIDAEDLGISIQASSSEFTVNTTSTSTQYNGLCGSSSGELIYSDCNTVANIANLTQVMEFANSHVVAARDQFLRDQSRQCGLISGNDTVIGDPLFTVPFLEDLTSLCFEVHGRTNTFINLVSDTCTSVNALYTAMQMPDNGNIISQVGVRAVGDSGQCYNVRVDLTGCATSVDGSPVTSSFNESGIRVRRTLNRVRISVPNCENKNLVMVVTCSLLPEPMIRFDIMRGLNLRPTSHGLLGQFWNIPITTQVFDADEDRYIVTVSPPGRPARRFITDRFNRVWDNSGRVCYYAGNGQGGRSGELPIADDSIIEGNYKNYLVADLYADEFVYNEFENERCAP